MARIFISYSRVDKDFTERFEKRLRRMFPDVNVWYDDHLYGGQNWWDEILGQIAQCDIFLYLLSNESVMSPYCQAEFTEARRLQKRIITVQIRDRTKLTDDLDDIQYVDFKNGINDGDAIASLSGAVRLQLTQITRKRPLWQPATPKPLTPAEEARSENAPDVDTPTLRVQAPSSANEAGLPKIIRDVLIGVVVTVIGGIILFILQPLFQTKELIPTTPVTGVSQIDTPIPTTSVPMQTTTAPDSTATNPVPDTESPQPTNTLEPPTPPKTFTPSATTPIVFEQIGLTPVASNAAWTPIERDFDGVMMVLVPVGCFMMGSENGDDDENPVHEQCFETPFWIDKYEVTNAQFDAFGGTALHTYHWTETNRPRENITWFEARAFCAKRGARLPTEREWEYAARGADALEYPWGNEWDAANAVYNDNANNKTADVGSRSTGASWVGTQDMGGNVWEWMSSIHQAYPYDADDGRESDTDSTNVRVLRGGSWDSNSVYLRSAYRDANVPGIWRNFIGVRCARS